MSRVGATGGSARARAAHPWQEPLSVGGTDGSGPVRHRRAQSGSTAAVLAAVVCTGLSAVTGNTWLLLLAGAALALVVHAWARRSRLDDVTVQLPESTRLVVGETASLPLTVRNTGTREVPVFRLVLSDAGLPVGVVLVGPLPAGGSAEATVEVLAPAREVVRELGVHLLSSDPFGLVEDHRHRTEPALVVVHPARRDPVAVPEDGVGSADGTGAPRRGHGADLVGVRDWRTGDGARHVHWRSTARHGRLVVAERGQPDATRWVVAVTAVSGSPETEELLALAAATCTTAVQEGVDLDVLAWVPAPAATALATGARPQLLTAPTGSVTALLDWWSGLDRFGVPAPEDVVRLLPPGTTHLVALDAPELSEPWWSHLGALARSRGATVHRIRRGADLDEGVTTAAAS